MLSCPLIILAFLSGSVIAQTSLYIPGFDPQPISADILGVDSQGRTTWALHKGTPTDTFDDSGFIGTATLVEGPNDASLTYVDPAGKFTMGASCSLSGDLAICSAATGTGFVTETETIDRFAIQAGTTASPAPTSADTTPAPSQPSDSSQNPGQSQPSSPSPSGPSQSTDNTSNPAPTSNAKALTPYITGLIISVMLVAVSV